MALSGSDAVLGSEPGKTSRHEKRSCETREEIFDETGAKSQPFLLGLSRITVMAGQPERRTSCGRRVYRPSMHTQV
jgi:hypothetical protein